MRAIPVLLMALLAGATDPVAAAWPGGASPERQGWLLGLVLGRGAGDFDLTEGEVHAPSGWSSGGIVVRGRIGRFLTRELLLTAEYGVWRRAMAPTDSSGASEGETGSVSIGDPVDRYLGAGIVAINLYPRVGGFQLRGGLGYGHVLAQADAEGRTLRAYAPGLLIVLGAGWEVGLAHDMSVTFGADFGRVETSGGVSGNFAQLLASLQLHFDRLLPREWF